ncbi:DUF4232 domain-containing protein [Streptomyces sp. NPDC094032]|uniref:DUF4232 domain-containing protein n=1 Tax=Streptomyces sp. NPDC094032 TaxID=3155308 RepID=UPI003319CB26
MNAVVRTSSRRPALRRTFALGAVTVAALLATAACGPGSDGAAAGGKASDRATATDSASPTDSAGPSESTSATTAPSPSRSSAPPKASPSSGGGGGGSQSSEVGLCTHRDLSFSAKSYDVPGEPVRHIMLVATNTSGRKCDLQGAPEVTLGNAKGPTPAKRATDPGEVLTLAPGGKAYAGLLATGGHRDTYDVKSMTIGLGSPGGEAEPEKPVALRMPVASFPADDGQFVTYWAGTEGIAMRPVTSQP